MKKYAIGDIHGCYKALIQCLERSKFNYKEDKLIVLGDLCDGWPYVSECFDEVLKIKNLVYILGNHDEWALEWFDRDDLYKYEGACPDRLWTEQGGRATLVSYGYGEMKRAHMELLKSAKLYHIEDNTIFVHAGIEEYETLERTDRGVFLWDRGLIRRVTMVHPVNKDFKIQDWDKIYIGHTSTPNLNGGKPEPIFACNVINLDTGAGWGGKLTIMDIESQEYWQSDLVTTLYPDTQGR